ncbi:Transposase [Thalictrum thalictroides]|uniref:Transposase n=1 Tax=Thalictrum thalictroides TaxID=46969 RepID=A0A7J6W1Y5_THATH|nr:Transposase [Thalictrum thalictroides]
MTFSIGFCFLPGEAQEDFTWAFRCFRELGINPMAIVMDGDQAQRNASEEVFPNTPTLLCIWHVNQCILAKCKNIVGQEDWKSFEAAWRTVMQAQTIEQFDRRWLQFQTQYSNPKTQQCVIYLQNEWLKPGQRERLVEAWTNQYLHFGIRVTSRAEGAHAYIKRYLGGKKTKGDLYSSWLHIEAAIINQITAVSTRTSIQQDRAPLDIDKKLYQGCFGIVTWHALRLVQRHLKAVSLPLQPCTGSFTRTMGLPCAHICDIKKDTGGLTPSDFHEHWYWERKSTLRPLLDPLPAGRQPAANLRTARTGRILSTGEEQPTRRLPTCSACHRQGHTRSSYNCPLKLQATIATQSQMLLDMDIVARQPALVPPTITASIPAFASPTTTHSPIELPLSSQISIDVQFSTASGFPGPEQPEQPRPQAPLQKQLSPDRPEVLIKAYLAEKTAWLAQHPTVRPTEYRRARKWKNPRPKVLKEQSFYMPKERRDLDGNVIAVKANWTNEEIMVWLDHEEMKEEEEYNRLQAEFDANGQRHAENGSREVWARVVEDVTRDSERYIL